MATVPIGLAIAGTALSAGSAVMGVIADRNAASYQAQVAANNAKIAEENARRSVQDAQRTARDLDEEARQDLGALVAEQSASGLSLDTGSSLLRRRAAERLAGRDRDRTREAGNLRAQGFFQQAADYESEAANARSRRKFATIGGALNVGSSLVGGAQSIRKARSLST